MKFSDNYMQVETEEQLILSEDSDSDFKGFRADDLL